MRQLLCLLALAVLAGVGPAAAEVPDPVAVEVAAGVYLLRGLPGAVDPVNAGRIGNAGFIVGPGGVIAVDSGVSLRHGRALLAAIRRVTEQPVRLLLLTHVRQEFVFGATAFRERGVELRMHALAARLMAARCEGCLRTLVRLLGDDEMKGTRVPEPDAVFDATQTLSLIGRPVRVLHFGHSSGPGDVAVFDEASGVLFAGGLLDHGTVPDVQDSDLPGWSRALAALRALPLRVVVPGHGAAAGPQLVDAVETYLQDLQRAALDLLQRDVPLSEVADRAHLPRYADWDEYDTIHRRNASVVFLRLERERLLRQ